MVNRWRIVANCLEVQFMRLRRSIELLLQQLPRCLDINSKKQNIVADQTVAPGRDPVPSMAQPLTEVHSE